MRVAAEAPHFEIEVARVQRVTQCRRWLRRPTEAEHALVPRFTREPIGLLAGFLGTPLSPHERMRRKSNAWIWWSSDMIAPNAVNGKPPGFARGSSGPQGVVGVETNLPI
jgi:hypothetical protein